MEQFGSLDHYGLGSWDSGAGEDWFGPWGWEDWDRMASEISLEGCNAVQAPQSHAAVEMLDPTPLENQVLTTCNPWDTLELEIPEENIAILSPNATFDFSTPSSAFTKPDTSVTLDDETEPAKQAETTTSAARNTLVSNCQWPCDFPICNQTFTHRHMLK